MPSNPLGQETTDNLFITHIEWNGMPELFSYGSNETGVRKIVNGEIDNKTFKLYQHGWHNWKAAGEFIKKAYAKGWDEHRIDKVMSYLRERKNTPPKGKTI